MLILSSDTERAAAPSDTEQSIFDFSRGSDADSDHSSDDAKTVARQPVHASRVDAVPSQSQAVSDSADSVNRQQIASELLAIANVSPVVQQSNSALHSASSSQSNAVISGAASRVAAVPQVSRSSW